MMRHGYSKSNKENDMKIGTFIADKDGILHGKVYGLGIGVTSVMFEPQTSSGGKEYYRLIADPVREAYEIGVAFPKEKGGKTYLSVSFDSPVLAAPVNAALFPDKEGTYNLVWNRRELQSPKADANVNSKPQQARGFASPNVN
jgi:uncharacterized protein (DUF736 family)